MKIPHHILRQASESAAHHPAGIWLGVFSTEGWLIFTAKELLDARWVGSTPVAHFTHRNGTCELRQLDNWAMERQRLRDLADIAQRSHRVVEVLPNGHRIYHVDVRAMHRIKINGVSVDVRPTCFGQNNVLTCPCVGCTERRAEALEDALRGR